MHKLINRTISTPKGAAYVKGVYSGSSVKVQYFAEGKTPIHYSQVNPAATYMTENEFKALVETKIEIGKSADLPYGRELLDREQEAVDDVVVDKDTDVNKKLKISTKKTKELKGKGPGTKVGQTKPGDPGKALKESNDNATYSWKSIHRALTEAQMTIDEIRQIALSLSGSEITEDVDGADIETALSTQDPARQTKPQEIFTGQPMRNVYSAIESISRLEAQDVANLPKGTIIKVIRHGQEAVSKILSSKVINTINQDGKILAEIDVGGKTITIVIGRNGTTFLKKGRKTGVFYYLSPIEE